jgi:hypothetical protein
MLNAGGRRALTTTVALAAAMAMLLLGTGAAYAQTNGYPVTTTSTTAPATICPEPPLVDLGTLGPNESGTAVVGKFTPGQSVTLSLNGGTTFVTVTADSRGCVTVTVLVTNSGTALGVLSFAAQGTHLAASGATVTINGVAGLTALPPGQQNTVTVTGPGVDGPNTIARVLFKTRPSAVSGEPFARTGARIAFWTLLGAGLIALGFLVASAARRRSATR